MNKIMRFLVNRILGRWIERPKESSRKGYVRITPEGVVVED